MSSWFVAGRLPCVVYAQRGLDIAAGFHNGKRRVRQDFVNEGFSKRLDAASVKTNISVMTKSNGEGASEPFE